MSVRFGKVRAVKEGDKVYLEIAFDGKNYERVEPEEIFEDYAEHGDMINLQIDPVKETNDPADTFFATLSKEEIKRVREALDLREFYHPVRDDLNVYKFLKSYAEKHPPELAFNCKTVEEHKKWAVKVIEKVKELCNYNLGDSIYSIEEGPETELRDIILKKYYIETAPGLKMPAILARPVEMKEPAPGIVAVHGHSFGKINTIGLAHSVSHSYYGMELALRGFVTVSPDQWGWGEREGYSVKLQSKPEAIFSLSALLLGLTAIGIRSYEADRAAEFLEKFDFVNGKFGIIGQSGGGTTAAFASVLSDRFYASVISGYFCSWFYSIFSLYHCPCNHIPSILRYIDIHDLIAARAPKPTFIVAGEHDPIFPLRGVKYSFEKAKKAFELYGKPENLQIDIIPRAGHMFRGDYAYPWLEKVLMEK